METPKKKTMKRKYFEFGFIAFVILTLAIAFATNSYKLDVAPSVDTMATPTDTILLNAAPLNIPPTDQSKLSLHKEIIPTDTAK